MERTKFIFRDVFPNISKEVQYCTNVFAAESCMDEYNVVHGWLNENNKSLEDVYTRMPHYAFMFSDVEKEAEFIEKFEAFMAPIEVDGQP